MHRMLKIVASTLAFVALLTTIIVAYRDDDDDDDDDRAPFARVLLISIDGMHATDLERFVAEHHDSALARLSAMGRTYTHASGTKPSDSFPGLLAMVTGGTPKWTGVYYDDGWDRSLAPATGPCVPGARVQWKQNLDVLPFTFTTTIDPLKLPRDPSDGCLSRVYPHRFPRVNNVFEVIKASGGRTAWSDKHPAYEFLNGPSGMGVDDLYTPEIATNNTTTSFALTLAYDDMKVAAIVNEINGFDHTGATTVGVPTLFGMNFQGVSVGQKLSPAGGPIGGYVDASGTPQPPLQAALEHTDQSIGAMAAALESQGLLSSTLIIVTAKHGNSPIDPTLLVKIDPAVIAAIVNSVPPGLAQLSADTGPLIWLKDQTTTAAVVDLLSTAENRALAHIDRLLSGPELAARFADPLIDPRTPDIIVLPVPGTVYTAAATKIADHGSFYPDDLHVALLVSNPSMRRRTITDPVETRQIACTILKALDLQCHRLESEIVEPSAALPRANRRVAPPRHRNSPPRPLHEKQR